MARDVFARSMATVCEHAAVFVDRRVRGRIDRAATRFDGTVETGPSALFDLRGGSVFGLASCAQDPQHEQRSKLRQYAGCQRRHDEPNRIVRVR